MKKILITLTISLLSLSLFAQDALNALNFDGIDDKVEITNGDFQFESQITVMGWIKWNVNPDSTDNFANIISVAKDDNHNEQFVIQRNTNSNLEFALVLEKSNKITRQHICSEIIMEKDVWIHFAATYNGNVQRLYINGILEATKGGNGNVRTFNTDMKATIGSFAPYNGRFFNGEIDEMSIWDIALTEDQILDFMNETLDETQEGLQAYYNFDEIVDDILIDLTNKDHDGTVYGAETVLSTAAVTNVILPIELLSFNAENIDNTVLINWSTVSEINNDYFTVERSIDGNYWEDIAYVEGADNSNVTVNYEIIDNDPVSGVSFYRLKQTDFDGTSETFKMLAIENSLVNELEVSVFPNPVVNVLNIQNESSDNLEVYLVNLQGQRIAVNILNVSGQVQIDMSSFSKGMYHLQIVSETGNVITKQIVKM
jgi:hypothetical protein